MYQLSAILPDHSPVFQTADDDSNSVFSVNGSMHNGMRAILSPTRAKLSMAHFVLGWPSENTLSHTQSVLSLEIFACVNGAFS